MWITKKNVIFWLRVVLGGDLVMFFIPYCIWMNHFSHFVLEEHLYTLPPFNVSRVETGYYGMGIVSSVFLLKILAALLLFQATDTWRIATSPTGIGLRARLGLAVFFLTYGSFATGSVIELVTKNYLISFEDAIIILVYTPPMVIIICYLVMRFVKLYKIGRLETLEGGDGHSDTSEHKHNKHHLGLEDENKNDTTPSITVDESSLDEKSPHHNHEHHDYHHDGHLLHHSPFSSTSHVSLVGHHGKPTSHTSLLTHHSPTTMGHHSHLDGDKSPASHGGRGHGIHGHGRGVESRDSEEHEHLDKHPAGHGLGHSDHDHHPHGRGRGHHGIGRGRAHPHGKHDELEKG